MCKCMSMAIEQTLAIMCVNTCSKCRVSRVEYGKWLDELEHNSHTGYADIPIFRISLIFKQDYNLPFSLDHFTTKISKYDSSSN